MISGDPSLPGYRVPGLELPRELSLDRVASRRSLLDAVDRTLGDGAAVDGLDAHYRKAFSLIASPEARRAFDLSREPEPSASAMGSIPATRAPKKRGSSAACPTWASACYWPGG